MFCRTSLAIATCAGLASLSSGCSVAFVTPVPAGAARGEARPHVDCASSNLAPIIDTALTAYQLVGVGYAATLDDADYARYPISRKTDMALGAGFAALFAGSAVYGYVTAARCRRVKQGPPAEAYAPGFASRTPRPEKARAVSGG